MPAVARGRSQGSYLFTVWNHRHHWTQHTGRSLSFPLVRSVSPPLILCASLYPRHTSLHSLFHAPWEDAAKPQGPPPGVAVQGEGSSSLPKLLAEVPGKGLNVPWPSGCSVSTPALSPGKPRAGQGPVPMPTGRGGGHSGPLRPAILPVNP